MELSSTGLEPPGFVRDYGELAPFKAHLDATLDHRHINDVVDFNPTAELLAEWLFYTAQALWPEVSAVRVYETPKTCAEYRP